MSKFVTVLKKLFWCFTNINKYNCGYKIVSLIGVIIRVILLPFLLPDVFEVTASFFISQLHCPKWLYEILLRVVLFLVDAIALSRVFYFISFFSVGNSYERGSNPAWGSICYTVYFTAYNAIPIIVIQHFQWWVISVTALAYIILCVAIYLLSAKLDTLPDSWILRAALHGIHFILIFVSVCLIKGYLF